VIVIENMTIGDTALVNGQYNTYRIRVNNKVITTIEHDREFEGLPSLLRALADAVETEEREEKRSLFALFRAHQSKLEDPPDEI
jgi:hypothetical protein